VPQCHTMEGYYVKALIITIEGHKQSNEAADRCRESAMKHGVYAQNYKAQTPEISVKALERRFKISSELFKEKYSRFENCFAAFCSHMRLWELAISINENILILEHDAVFVNDIPNIDNMQGCINLGKPSYGKFNVPNTIGLGPLMSKPYFPGAHAYVVSPSGAQELINQARWTAKPTDLFLNKNQFPFLQEYYPWPIEAHDTFTTIQNTTGCLAKHNFNKDYAIC
jgi:GR25 family glycosyltransferase involved in LPS biosynthesis